MAITLETNPIYNGEQLQAQTPFLQRVGNFLRSLTSRSKARVDSGQLAVSAMLRDNELYEVRRTRLAETARTVTERNEKFNELFRRLFVVLDAEIDTEQHLTSIVPYTDTLEDEQEHVTALHIDRLGLGNEHDGFTGTILTTQSLYSYRVEPSELYFERIHVEDEGPGYGSESNIVSYVQNVDSRMPEYYYDQIKNKITRIVEILEIYSATRHNKTTADLQDDRIAA